MKEYTLAHLIKSEDLNHHGTLFAGRMAEWFVEGTFVAAASTIGNPDNVVCIKLHGLKFGKPAKKGDIITLTTKVADVGTTSMTVYGAVKSNSSDEVLVDGFITFVCVDENGVKMPHNIVMPEDMTVAEIELRERAKNLK